MKRVRTKAKCVGAILLALCLLVTCGHGADLGGIFTKTARAATAEPEETPDAGEAGDGEEEGEPEEEGDPEEGNITDDEEQEFTAYTLYNFVKVGNKYGRLRKTTIHVENDPTHYINNKYKLGDRYLVPQEEFRFEEGDEAEYDFSGETFVYNNLKYAWSEDFAASDKDFADYAGYYVVKGTADENGFAVIKNKIGGTSLTGFQALDKDGNEISFNDKNADSFHRDYEIEFVDCKRQDLYNYAKIGNMYYRLAKVTKIDTKDISQFETGKMADGTYECEEYDFANATLTLEGIRYTYRDEALAADVTDYAPYYTVDFSRTEVSKWDRFTVFTDTWKLNDEAWIEGVAWVDENGELLPNNTTAFHRDYMVTLHKSGASYTVTWYDSEGDDKEVLDELTTEQYGDIPVYGGDEIEDLIDEGAQSETVFIGWNIYDEEGNAIFYAKGEDLAPIAGDQEYFAVYKTSFTVTFLDPEGEVLQTGLVEEGEQPVYGDGTDPVSEDEKEVFKGWKVYVEDASENEDETGEDAGEDGEVGEAVLYTGETLPAVTASVTYIAVFEKTEDPVEPGDDPVEPGDDPVEPGDDPVEPGDDPVEPGDDPQTSTKSGNDITFYKGDTTVEPICVKDSVDDSQTFETFGGVRIDDKLVSHVNYDTKKGSLILTFDAAYLETVALGDHKVSIHFVGEDQDVDVTLHVKSRDPETEDPAEEPEKKEHEYYLFSGDNGVHTKTTDETLTFVFKCKGTDTDETYHHFAAMNMDGAIASTINYNAAAGSLVLTLTAEYLESLALGEHTLTALFDDGNDVDAHFTIVEKTEDPEQKDEPTDPEQKDEPTDPEQKDEPTEPEQKDEPTEPEQKDEPAESEQKDEPTEPAQKDEPTEPAQKDEPAKSEEPAKKDEPAADEKNEQTKPAETETKPVEVTPAKAESTVIPAKADSAITGGDSAAKTETSKTEESAKPNETSKSTVTDDTTKTNNSQKTDDSGNSATGEGSTPKTGDTMGPVYLIALLAAVVMMTLVFYRKRKAQF
ncbi:MAG: LPXTG cell wall anchor domain-containing protein [Lachnospiraceae bacterium]|nr:LPXTG cell wall anchor domain-containing protein [Lachnospiraceae bacterium]